MKHPWMRILIGVVLVVGFAAVAIPPQRAYAAACVSTQSGNWNVASTWTSCGGSFPGSSDTASVSSNHIVSFTTAATVGAVTVNGTLQLTGGNLTLANKADMTVTSGGKLDTLGFRVIGNGNGSNAQNFTVNSGGTLGVGDASGITTSGSTGSIQVTGTRSYSNEANYIYNGSAAQVTGNGLPASVNNLTINNSAGVTLSAAATVNGTLTLTNGTLTNSTNNVTLANGATISRATGSLAAAPGFGTTVNVIYTGSTGVTTGPELPTSTSVLNDLTVNNSGDVTLGAAKTVNGTLTLTSGLFKVAGFNLTLQTGASISGGSTSSMVVTDTDGSATGDGFLCKNYAGNVSFTFPVGDASGTTQYSPSTLNFTANLTNPSTVCVRVTNARHPSWPGAAYPTYINRYWTVTSTDNAFTCTASFTYVDTSSGQDVVIGSGQSEASLYHKIWNGSTWTTGSQTNTGTNTISTQVSSFSDHTAFSGSPLAVTLADFSAVQQGNFVLLTWETNSELDNRGFNLYRGTSAAGWDRQLNETLIPSQSQGNPGGFVYTWEDRADLVPGTAYFYWVEDVDIYGVATMHGPVSVDYTAPTAVTLSGIQASPVAVPALPMAGTLLALLALFTGALGIRRRRRA